jgi:hypothetical protein
VAGGWFKNASAKAALQMQRRFHFLPIHHSAITRSG